MGTSSLAPRSTGESANVHAGSTAATQRATGLRPHADRLTAPDSRGPGPKWPWARRHLRPHLRPITTQDPPSVRRHRERCIGSHRQ